MCAHAISSSIVKEHSSKISRYIEFTPGRRRLKVNNIMNTIVHWTFKTYSGPSLARPKGRKRTDQSLNAYFSQSIILLKPIQTP